MRKIYMFQLQAGSHEDQASGNKYECTPDKQIPAKPDAEDQNPTFIAGDKPVFKSGAELDKVFRAKFMRVADDTPTTHPPDGYALAAMAYNEAEAKRLAPPEEKKVNATPTVDRKGNRKN